MEAESLSIRVGRRPEPGLAMSLPSAMRRWRSVRCMARAPLAQMAILRALDLLPGRDCHPIELGEYVRLTGQETIRVRDFLALHYLRSGRTEGAFWQFASRGQAPDTLAHTLQQFESRGRLPFYEEESFTPHSWTAVMHGMGIPRGRRSAPPARRRRRGAAIRPSRPDGELPLACPPIGLSER